MKLSEKVIRIPVTEGHGNLLTHIQNEIELGLKEGEVPVRFVITHMDRNEYNCELATLEGQNYGGVRSTDQIFRFVPRKVERTGTFNTVFLVPTGIGAEIGGHAGDATPAARAIAAACARLITHPHVGNASAKHRGKAACMAIPPTWHPIDEVQLPQRFTPEFDFDI